LNDDGIESAKREFDLLENAINAVRSQVPPTLNIDGDNDGRVDSLTFIVSGSPEGWSDLLWPHERIPKIIEVLLPRRGKQLI